MREKQIGLLISHDTPVNHLIGGALIKSVVKSEGLVLQVARQVHFLLGLVNHDHILTGNGDHVQTLHRQLWKAAVFTYISTCESSESEVDVESLVWWEKQVTEENLTFLIEGTLPDAHTYSMLFNLHRATHGIPLFQYWGPIR